MRPDAAIVGFIQGWVLQLADIAGAGRPVAAFSLQQQASTDARLPLPSMDTTLTAPRGITRPLPTYRPRVAKSTESSSMPL